MTGRRSILRASTPTARSARRSPQPGGATFALDRHGGSTARDRRPGRDAGVHHDHRQAAQPLFAAGKNVKQVQVWLGHADPGFTVRTYVHLMDEGLGDADFLDDVVGDRRTIQ